MPETKKGDPKIPYGPTQKPWGQQVPEYATVTAPVENPTPVYPKVPPPTVKGDFPKIDYTLFEIPPTGLTDTERTTALAALKTFAETQHSKFTGYQVNQSEKYSHLSWLMDMHTNNVGDPFQTGIFILNTKFVERAVIDYFAALWNNTWPHHQDTPKTEYPNRQWGYILSMGSTEANIYGLFNARDYLKGRALIEDPESTDQKKYMYSDPLPSENVNAYTPIVFYSQDAHYSIVKAVRILELTTFYQEGNAKYPGQCPITENGEWPQEVLSHNTDNGSSGTVNVDDLEKLVTFFVEKGYPPLIVLNYGSTWKGAYDNVPAVNDVITKLGKKFPWLWERTIHYDPDNPDLTDVRRGFWVHVDGALGAGYMPFVEMAHNQGKIKEKGPVFDFRNTAVMSICCSMHKWFGAPWPGAVYMTRIGYQLRPPSTPSYIGSADTTLGGSRNAFSAVVFWDYLARHSYEDSIQDVVNTEKVGTYLVNELKKLEKELKDKYGDVDLWIARSKLALAVRFRLVNPDISYKYTVDSERLWVPISQIEEQERTYSHVYCMQSVTTELVDKLIQDIKTACKDDWHNGFPTHDGDLPNPGKTRPVTPPTRGKRGYRLFVPHEGRGLGSFVHPSKRG
jgi:histidine decarboxylase